jgi:hypothetical protein
MARDQYGPDVPGAATDRGDQVVPSRRSVLRGAAGVGAAGIAATAFAGLGARAVATESRSHATDGAGRLAGARSAGAGTASAAADDVVTSELVDGEPIVAHLRDASTGRIDLFRGTSQVEVHDAGLAAQLVRAARGAQGVR